MTHGYCKRTSRTARSSGEEHDLAVEGVRAQPAGINWPRAVMFLDVALVPLIVFWAIGHEEYLLSAVFGVLFSALADPGRSYGYRASHIAVCVSRTSPAHITAKAAAAMASAAALSVKCSSNSQTLRAMLTIGSMITKNG